MTNAQHECLLRGITSEHCLDNHQVCLHCGACRTCSNGCGCDGPFTPCNCGDCDEYEEKTMTTYRIRITWVHADDDTIRAAMIGLDDTVEIEAASTEEALEEVRQSALHHLVEERGDDAPERYQPVCEVIED